MCNIEPRPYLFPWYISTAQGRRKVKKSGGNMVMWWAKSAPLVEIGLNNLLTTGTLWPPRLRQPCSATGFIIKIYAITCKGNTNWREIAHLNWVLLLHGHSANICRFLSRTCSTYHNFEWHQAKKRGGNFPLCKEWPSVSPPQIRSTGMLKILVITSLCGWHNLTPWLE